MQTRFLPEAQIQERIREHTSARYTRLDRLDRYVKTTQYEGRPDWFNDDVELFKRAPNVRSKIVGCAIDAHLGLVFKKCPNLTTGADEDESTLDPTYGLDEETSAKVDAGLSQVVKHAGLLAVWKRMLRDAMSTGSAVAIPAVRNGKLVVDVTSAKWCTPTWSQTEPGKVDSLEILYPFVQDIQDPVTRRWGKTVALFRRVIDETSDTTYLPVEAPQRRTDPVMWIADPQKTVKHSLGFCPVVWYRFMGKCTATHEHDGEAIHAQLLDEITALDFAESQRNRASLYTADPIVTEIGVMPGYMPTETVFSSGSIPGVGPNGESDAGTTNAQWRSGMSSQMPRRKRAPGQAWQYQNEQAKVDYLTLPADALEGCMKNAAALAKTICDTLHWDPIDPKEMQSDATLSGRSLEMLYTKQVNYCDDVRGDFAENALLPVVDMLLRICVAMAKRKARLALPGFDVLVNLLGRFEQKDTAQWVTPRMTVKWADYFAPAEAEQKALAETMAMLVEKGLLKRETAVAAIAQVIPSLDIENPAEYAADIEAEQKAKAEEAFDQQKQMAEHSAALKPPPSPPGRPAPGQGAPPKPPAKPPVAAAPAPREPRQPKSTPFKKPPPKAAA
jgi:hypothetical protein